MKKHYWIAIIALFYALYLALPTYLQGGWLAVGESFLCLIVLFALGVWYGVCRRAPRQVVGRDLQKADIATIPAALFER